MATELDPNNSWKTEQQYPLRSRYTGYPLKEQEMVITILSQGSFTFGHQVIVFEWGHGYNEGHPYRKHKGFHLFPARGQSVNELGFSGSARSVVPSRIERFRQVGEREVTTESGEKYMEKFSVKPSNDQKGNNGQYYAEQARITSESKFLIGAKYRSWMVEHSKGHKAFLQAKAQWKDSRCTPSFNLLGVLGHNCGTWAQSIASLAGIDPTSFSAKIGFPVPIWEVYGGGTVSDENEIWKKREGRQ